MTETNELAALERAATAASPVVSDAFASLSWDGPGNRAVLVILYVTDASQTDAVVAAVDSAFDAVWHAADFSPVKIAIGAVAHPKPAEPTTWEPTSIDPRVIAAALVLPKRHIADTWISLPAPVLQQRYGARTGVAQ